MSDDEKNLLLRKHQFQSVCLDYIKSNIIQRNPMSYKRLGIRSLMDIARNEFGLDDRNYNSSFAAAHKTWSKILRLDLIRSKGGTIPTDSESLQRCNSIHSSIAA